MTEFGRPESDTTGLTKSMLKYGSRNIMLSQVNQVWHLFGVANQTDSIRLMFLQIFRPEILEARTSIIEEKIWRMSLDWSEIRTRVVWSQILVKPKCNEGTLDH